MTYAEIEAEWIVVCAEAEYWLQQIQQHLNQPRKPA